MGSRWLQVRTEYAERVAEICVETFFEVTKEFMEALEEELNLIPQNTGVLKTTRRGKYGGTWVAPEIFVDITMWKYNKNIC